MKNLLFLIFLFFIISCNEDVKKENLVKVDSTNTPTPKAIINEKETLTDILSKTHGIWVKKDYTDSILKFRSPFQSRDLLNDCVTLIIDSTNTDKDSVFIGTSWNNHEGFGIKAAYKSLNNLETDLINYDDPKSNFIISPIDSEQLNLIELQNGKMVNETPFIKVLNNQPDDEGADYGLNYFVKENLFEGSFTPLKKYDNISQLNFDAKGLSSGYKYFDNYWVLTDFIGPTQTDIICFNSYDETDCYSFSFNDDTLNLHEISRPDTLNTDFEKQGEILYQLTKKTNR